MNLTEIAKKQEEFVVQTRRDLHHRPETRWQEDETLGHIRQISSDILAQRFESGGKEGFASYLFQITDLKGGLVVDYTVDPELPRVLFRADVDALAIQEEIGLSFASEVPCKMHACGHDCHAAMLLGAMRVIVSGEFKPTKNIRFVFQRAEENPGTEPEPVSGGDMLVNQEKICEDISSAHMLHVWATGKPGVFYSRPGAFLGNSGRIRFLIKTIGGHAAHPHLGYNALWITHEIHLALDRFVSINLPPTEPVALEPVILKAGTASNVMPSEAELWYSCRTMLPPDEHAEIMDLIEKEVRDIVDRAPDSSVEITKIRGHPALINNEADFIRVRELLECAGEIVEIHPPILGGEDFAHYLYKVPGSAWLLGANQPSCGDHHSPTFNPDESVLWKGVLFWLLLATSK